jgi:hypothetical protein
MSKKFSLIIALALTALAMPARADTSGVYSKKGVGTFVGGTASDKVGFHGVAGVQNPATDTAFKSMQDHGGIAAGADYSVQHKTITLSAAQIIAMYTTPVQLIAAPGAGKSIVVAKAAFTIVRTSTAFTGGAAAIVQYDSTANGGGTQALDSTLASTVITGAAGTTVSLRNGAIISDLASTSIQNKGLFISNGTAVFAAGTGTATVDVWYYVY